LKSTAKTVIRKDVMEVYRKTAEYLKKANFSAPDVCVVLGTGLSGLGESGEKLAEITYREIPGFPLSTVGTHKGILSMNRIGSRNVLFMQGRFHLYEGYEPVDIAFPVRVMRLLGCKTYIVSNAAGGVGRHLDPGDLMLITDHINFTGVNPLTGPNDESLGPRFPEMDKAYDPELKELARKAARKEKISLKEGIYFGLRGPSMETDAEYRMVGLLGGDAVGMSTVTEVIAAVHCGMRVLGFSVIANKFGGGGENRGSFKDVVATASQSGELLARLITRVIKELDREVK